MKIGIISDTHDNIIKIKEAVNILNSKNVNFVIHCGDFVAPFSIKPLANLNCDWLGVFGNNDGEKAGLLKESKDRIKEPPYILILFSKKILVMHDFKNFTEKVDVVLYGHTHKAKIEKGDVLRINPGEVCGWLYNKSSLAILDIDSFEVEIVYF